MFFLSDSLLPSLSGYIIPFPRSGFALVYRSSRFVYLFVLEGDNRGNMIVHIVIDKKGETLFHFLTLTKLGTVAI